MDRIGGSFTHLESELADHLKPFKGMRLTTQDKESFLFAKDLLLIFIKGILPDLEKYTLALDQMYLYHRKLHDLTPQGRIEKSSEICNDMHKIVRTKLSHWRFVFQNEFNRDMIIRFSVWLLQLVNYIDEAVPDLVYMLPDHVIQIPFEVLRMIKRESEIASPEGMPLSAVSTSTQDSGQISAHYSAPESLLAGLLDSAPSSRLVGKRRELFDTFYRELVTFISRHFLDDRIANPDLQQTYLVRMNILL